MIRIGTRTSRLAMVQTETIKAKILQAFPMEEVEIVPIVTKGDKELDKHLSSFGGKGVFTKEIEDRLLDGSIDLAVHSAKDIPMEFPDGLSLGAVAGREDARDVLLVKKELLNNLPCQTEGRKLTEVLKQADRDGYVVGTSSLRRELQIKHLIPQAQIQVLRGNVPTRLQKLKDGKYDAILLAAAGLKRLHLDEDPDICYEYLEPDEFVPAAGQGILAVEIRTGDLPEVMKALNDESSYMALQAERAFLAAIGGSCNAPCGVYCRPVDHLTEASAEHGIETTRKEQMFDQGTVVWQLSGMYAGDGRTPSFRSVKVPVSKVEQCVEEAVQLAASLRYAHVSIVGAGPGKRDLISCRAMQCVREADVLIYDNLISPSILNEARQDAQLLYAGKRADAHSMKQEEINALLIQKAEEGNYVVRLKGGDPFVFGRGGEEALALKAQGIPYEIVPGVSSAYSVPAYAGIPVTHRGVAASFHVITGREGDGKSESGVDYEVLAKEKGTLIFLMGLRALGTIAKKLTQYGKAPDTPAAVIQSGATARQRTVSGTLADIEALVREAGLRTPAMIVIGNVVALQDQLGWQQSLPLSGKQILLTGTRRLTEQLGQQLEPLGAETVRLSLVETHRCLDEEAANHLRQIQKYTWIVFTSGAGVCSFFETLGDIQDDAGNSGMDLRSLGHVKFAAVGASTAAELKKYGYHCDFLPKEYVSKELAREWIPTLEKDDVVLLVRAKEGSDYLQQALQQAGIAADLACLYETKVDTRRKEELLRHINEVDYTVLASGSAARALRSMAGDLEITSKVAVIGPVTKEACEKAGIPVSLVAEEHTAAGIAKVICED